MANNEQQGIEVGVTESGNPIYDMSARFVADVYGAHNSGEIFGYAVMPDGTVELPAGQAHEAHVATAALISILSRVYLAGRADQIADGLNNNTQRTVRARHIPALVSDANSFWPTEGQLDTQEIQETFDACRGLLDPEVLVILHSEDPKVMKSLRKHGISIETLIGRPGEFTENLEMPND